jgi:protein-disulfide isomerase
MLLFVIVIKVSGIVLNWPERRAELFRCKDEARAVGQNRPGRTVSEHLVFKSIMKEIMMRQTYNFLLQTAALVTVLYFSVFTVSAQEKVKPSTPDATAAKQAIEKIVREYLLKNPEVLREAMQALQAKEEEEKKQLIAKQMKSLQAEIYSDPDSPFAGKETGNVSVVVFFDYFCGYCKKTLPALPTLLPKDSSLRIVYKELPILGPASQLAAHAALAARRQGKYAEFHQALVEADGADEAVIKAISDRLGLNYAVLQKDMKDPKISEAIDRNLRLAAALQINGTPAYLVGEQIIPGAIDAASLAQLIAAERAKAASIASAPSRLPSELKGKRK